MPYGRRNKQFEGHQLLDITHTNAHASFPRY